MASGPYAPWVLLSQAAMRRRGDRSVVSTGDGASAAKGTKLRVFAFAQAGTGASGWHGHDWHAALPDDVEFMPVELPGRALRIDEPAPDRMSDLVRDAADGLGDVLDECPYALVGHSFGSWVAFELARERVRRGKTGPVKVYASGMRAPRLAGPEHDVDALCKRLSDERGNGFWAHFERRYGVNPEFNHPYVREMIEATLRSDFRLLETYEGPGAAAPPLRCPLTACGANGDNRYSRDQLAAWAAHTAAEYDERWFDGIKDPEYWGTPHRYLLDGPKAFQAFLRDDLAANVLPALPDRPPPPPAKAAPAFSSLKPAAAPAAPAAADVPADREKDRVALAALVVLAAVALYSAW